jgi:hypothetical protein
MDAVQFHVRKIELRRIERVTEMELRVVDVTVTSHK